VKTSHQQVRYTGYCDATRTNTNIYTQLLFSPSLSSIASWLLTLQRAMTVRYLSCRRLSCRKRPAFYFAIAFICAKSTSSIKSVLCEVILILSEVKWSYGEGLGDKSATYFRVTLYWVYLIILWLFHLGISCTVFVLTLTVVVVTCFVMCGCVCVCVCVCVGVGVLVICILLFTVFCNVCIVVFYIVSFM